MIVGMSLSGDDPMSPEGGPVRRAPGDVATPAAEAGAGVEVVGAVDRRTALSDLYRAEYRNLVRLATLLVDQQEAAEEIVQEAFVRLDRSWDRVQDAAARPAYLRSIVMNLARSGLRRRMVARRHRPDSRPDAPAAEQHAVLREDQREVLAALDTLSMRQRQCVVLRFYEDMTDVQIAEALGISPGSVKQHLHRAMQSLTDRLEALA
jgi:RNA polymerase sigma-70 factor (sigma-E family)